MTNFKSQDPVDIPYLFQHLTKREEDQLSAMQDFMQQHHEEIPNMTVRAILHHMAIQLQNVIDIWQKDLVKQGSVTEPKKKQLTNTLLAQTIAFLLANKAHISSKYDILKSAATLLSLLYPPSNEGAK